MSLKDTKTKFPSIEKPWLKYYEKNSDRIKLPECSMYEYLYICNQNRQENIALDYFGNLISYKELFNNIDRFASSYIQLGVRKNDIVLCLFLSIPECIYSIYALNKIGAICDMESPLISTKDLYNKIKLLNINYIVTVDTFINLVQNSLQDDTEINKIVVLPASNSLPLVKRTIYQVANKPKVFHNSIIINYRSFIDGRIEKTTIVKADDDKAIILKSGGTTGVPKDVLMSNENMNAVALQYHLRKDLQLEVGEKILNIAPIFLAFGISLAIHAPLTLGMIVCLSPDPDPKVFSSMFLEYKPVHLLNGIPHIANFLDNNKISKMNLSFIKTIGCGGESISSSLEEKVEKYFSARGMNEIHVSTGYGMTEFCGTAVVSSNQIYKVGSVGVPFPMTNIRIVDPSTGMDCGFDEEGEIWLTSPSMMISYMNNEKEMQKAVVIDHGIRWMKTGDIGTVDNDGFVYIKGRIKRIYLTTGPDGSIYKLFPDYIDDVIQMIDGISSSGTIAVSSDGKFYKAVSYVVLSKYIDINTILKYCQNSLPEYEIPEKIIAIDQLPITQSGKTNYLELENQYKLYKGNH